jgi:integrase
MPIETITKNGRKRFRWTFERVIAGQRVRRTKIIPFGITAAEADSLGRKWEAEEYAIASGERKAKVSIWQCVERHVTDVGAQWKDGVKRARVLQKWSDHFADQDATDLYDWSVSFVGYLRAHTDTRGLPKMPLTNASISNIMAYIRAAIKYAYKIGFVARDDTSRMAIPAVNNERHHYPDRREMLLIARCCTDRRARAAIRIAFYSGMRRAEIMRAKVTKQGFALGTTKNGKPRIVPIHPRIAVCTRRIKIDLTAPAMSHYWIKARERAGFPETKFHDLRHGAASEMINAGVDLFVVGGVLGHISMVSTKRYSHLVTDKLADAVGMIGGRK